MRRDMGKPLWPLVMFLAALSAWAAAPAAQEAPGPGAPPSLVVTSLDLNDIYPGYDGQWQGISVASDGNCYFACCSHMPDHGAGFFRYDPRSGQMKVLCEDITRVCGEDAAKTTPQGKIHSDIVEADGWLYFATHMGNWGVDKYPGAHVVGYEMATGRFRDFGVVRPKHVIYSGVAVDAARGCLYAYVTPAGPWRQKADDPMPDYLKDVDGSHLYRIDIRSGEKRDLGLVKGWDKLGACGAAAFYLMVDKRGDCWFTLYNHPDGGALYCARAATGKLERFENALPLVLSPKGEPVAAGTQDRRGWSWIRPLGDGERFVFTLAAGRTPDNRLWIFDPRRDVKEMFQPVAQIGPCKAVALAGDRVYLLQQADPAETRRDADSRLRSLVLGPEGASKVADHGAVADRRGHKPRSAVMAADGSGKVYIIGQWFTLPGETGCVKGNMDGKRMDWRMLFVVVEAPGR